MTEEGSNVGTTIIAVGSLGIFVQYARKRQLTARKEQQQQLLLNNAVLGEFISTETGTQLFRLLPFMMVHLRWLLLIYTTHITQVSTTSFQMRITITKTKKETV